MIPRSSSVPPVSVDREIRAARPSAPRDFSPFFRVYVRLAYAVRDADGPFETVADWLEATKCACALARVPYAGHAIWSAAHHVMLDALGPAPPRAESTRDVWTPPRPWGRAQATKVMRRIEALTGHGGPSVHAIPMAEVVSVRNADRQQALEIVARAIQASIERCAALESDSGDSHGG